MSRSVQSRIAYVALAAVLAGLMTSCSSPAGDARAQDDPGYVVVNTFPHDQEAYTQGLAFHRGRFYEGTGLNGSSWLRRVQLKTGEVKKQRDLAQKYFGEGVTVIGDRIYQITWTSETAFVYDVDTFKRLRTLSYNEDDDKTEEGWGLADNGKLLAMSDGTEIIRFRKPRTFEVTREISVTEAGTPVFRLNELEWIGDEIFANVYGYDHVVRINPETGEVTGRLDLAALRAQEQSECADEPEVTNGIAYLQSQERFFVTGKNWCHLYEIELTDPPG
jgi:glutamine cyclotransferase